jgi:lipopolysaccharide transport system ATP-binding protein
LRAVKVLTENGEIAESIDIRQSVGIEMEFEVLQPGHILAPNYNFFNEEGVCAFVAIDQDPTWRRRPRPAGIYVSTVWIPGNSLAEGSLIVGAAVSTMESETVHFHERDAVAFHVVDSLEGGSARGDYAGYLPGVVRPLLQWTTRYSPTAQAIEEEVT